MGRNQNVRVVGKRNAQAARQIIRDEKRRLRNLVERAVKYGLKPEIGDGKARANQPTMVVDIHDIRAALSEAEVNLTRAEALIEVTENA